RVQLAQQVMRNPLTLPDSIDTYKGPAPNQVIRWMSVLVLHGDMRPLRRTKRGVSGERWARLGSAPMFFGIQTGIDLNTVGSGSDGRDSRQSASKYDRNMLNAFSDVMASFLSGAKNHKFLVDEARKYPPSFLPSVTRSG